MFKNFFRQGASALVAATALACGTPASAGQEFTYTVEGSFSEGCFGMCLCAIFWYGDLEGSFRLVPYEVHEGGKDKVPAPGASYTITDVDLSVGSGTASHHFTGLGSYSIVHGIITTHQLVLDLVDDKGQTRHFDSGMIPGGEKFPQISIDLADIMQPDCYGSWLSVNATPAPTPPLGDLNGDMAVNGIDLGILLSQWSPSPQLCGPAFCPADLNQDGIVNGLDLGIMLAAWTG